MIQSHFNKLKPGSIVVINKNIVSKDGNSFIVGLDSNDKMKNYAGTVAEVTSCHEDSVHLKDAKTREKMTESWKTIPWYWSRDTIRHPRGSERELIK